MTPRKDAGARVWGLFAVVLITTVSVLGLRMLGLYEGFDAPAEEEPGAEARNKYSRAGL